MITQALISIQVMINGTCMSKDNCVTCEDHGTSRRNHEVWNRDKCTSCICEGSIGILKLLPCKFHQMEKLTATEQTARQKFVALDTLFRQQKMINAVQLNFVSQTIHLVAILPSNLVDLHNTQFLLKTVIIVQDLFVVEIQYLFLYFQKSILHFVECSECPLINENLEPLSEGEEYVEHFDGCCQKQEKVCNKENCSPQEDCSDNLVQIPDPLTNNACCAKFKCGMSFN